MKWYSKNKREQGNKPNHCYRRLTIGIKKDKSPIAPVLYHQPDLQSLRSSGCSEDFESLSWQLRGPPQHIHSRRWGLQLCCKRVQLLYCYIIVPHRSDPGARESPCPWVLWSGHIYTPKQDCKAKCFCCCMWPAPAPLQCHFQGAEQDTGHVHGTGAPHALGDSRAQESDRWGTSPTSPSPELSRSQQSIQAGRPLPLALTKKTSLSRQ